LTPAKRCQKQVLLAGVKLPGIWRAIGLDRQSATSVAPKLPRRGKIDAFLPGFSAADISLTAEFQNQSSLMLGY